MGASSDQKYECRICGAVFNSNEELSRHNNNNDSSEHDRYTTTEGSEDQTR
jgi:hypothetical protein